jgi:hypothetical protein
LDDGRACPGHWRFGGTPKIAVDQLYQNRYISTMRKRIFDSVWDALENSPAEAANMKARSGLMIAIRDVVDGWHLTQAEAAKRLGVTQPRMHGSESRLTVIFVAGFRGGKWDPSLRLCAWS